MKAGANDYVMKGNLERLAPTLERELAQAALRAERRQAQLERDRTLDMLQSIADNTAAVIYVKDLQGRYRMVNRRFTELFPVGSAQINGKSDSELFPENTADALRSVDRRVVVAKAPMIAEETVPLEDGSHTYISVKAPLRDRDGRVQGVFGISTDITERKRMEQALRESEARTRLIIEGAPDAVVTMNVEGAITHWNAQAERTFGWSRSEAVGRTFADSIVPPQPTRHLRTRRDRRARCRPETNAHREPVMSFKHGPKPGHIEILLVEDSPTQAEQLRHMLETHGYRTRVASNGTKAIEAVAAYTPHLVLSDVEMPEMDGYALCRAIKSDERWSDTPVILVTSRADPADVLRGLACGADGFVRKPCADEYLLRRIEQELMSQSLRRSARSTPEAGIAVYAGGKRHVIKPPPRQVLDLLISTYEQALSVNEELRARERQIGKLNEQLARRAEELEGLNEQVQQKNHELAATHRELQAANRELESFASSVSNDLRAPLRAIDDYSALLLRNHADNLSAEGLRYLGLLRVGAYRMAQLIEDLLSFAKTARQPLQRRPVNLAALLDDAVSQFRGEIANRHIDLEVHELPDCEADAALLRQVFVNLLSNAVKYTRLQEHPVIEVGCRDEHGEHVIFVKDNGAGFDMHDSDKLFGVFQRLHRLEEFEGTGIGLAIVKRIVERHGGRVWAEAVPGRGATFYLTLEGSAA